MRSPLGVTFAPAKVTLGETVRSIPGLNLISPTSTKAPTKSDLEGFKRAQSLAYESAVSVGQLLRPGMTERQAAALIEDFLADHSVKSFFHTSMVWFGDQFEEVLVVEDGNVRWLDDDVPYMKLPAGLF